MPHCPKCGKTIDADSYFCPFCGMALQQPVTPEQRVGPPSYTPPYQPPAWALEFERVRMGEVLSAAWQVVTRRPILLLPHLISALVGTLLGIGASMSFLAFFEGVGEGFAPLAIGALLLVFVISTTIEGLYPLLTKGVLDGEPVDLGGAARHALNRFFSLLGAAFLIFLITLAGAIPIGIGFVLILFDSDALFLAPLALILLIIGMILVLYITCWYYCAIPALMLEDRGALDALSASKAFSQGKKWSIFGLIVVVSLISGFVNFVFSFVPGTIGLILVFLITLFFTVYNSVIRSYLYIRYSRTLRVVSPPPTMVFTPPPVSPPPPETRTTCPTCGAEIEPGQSYCGWCGSKLP